MLVLMFYNVLLLLLLNGDGRSADAVMETCSACSLRPVVNYLSLCRYAAELNSAHNETMKQLGKCW